MQVLVKMLSFYTLMKKTIVSTIYVISNNYIHISK